MLLLSKRIYICSMKLMKITYYIKLFLALGFFISQDLSATISDSININSSYDKIQKLFYNNETKDSVLAKYYAELYLNKAKENKDKYKIAKGYLFFSYINTNHKGLDYCDSAIYLTKNSRDQYFPTSAFLSKGEILYKTGEYKKALNIFIKAYKYAKEKNNTDHLFIINQSIATLKNKFGSYGEALRIYKKMFDSIISQSDYKNKDIRKYLIIMYDLSISYMDNEKYDSASIFINKGLEDSSLYDNIEYKNKFTFIEGTNAFYKNNYGICIEKINNTLPFFERNNEIKTLAYIYLGKSYFKLGNKDFGAYNLLIADSLFNKSEYKIDKKISEGYKLLLNFYKEKKDYKNQLKFLNKLIKRDSIDKNYFVSINNTIKIDYEIPILLEEKEKLLKEIQSREENSQKYVYLLALIVAILIIILVWNDRKKRIYKEKFKKIISEQQKQQIKQEENKDLGIPIDIVNNVIDNLIKLEKDKFYLDPEINLQILSKRLETNSNYLSRIINHYKKCNFSTYINELRIDECIDRLKKDRQFRKYTIQAIANDSGFKSHQSFSKAFYKIKGLTPSYFLKQLNDK